MRLRDQSTALRASEADAFRTFGNNPTQQTSDAASKAARRVNALNAKSTHVAADFGFSVCGQPVK